MINSPKSTNNESRNSQTVSDFSATQSDTLLSSTENASNAALNRKKILITGCSSGIGYDCAKKLHKDGHIVVASCRNSKDVKKLIDEGLHAVQLDLDCSDSIDNGIRDTLVITNGELDVLINNGAYGQPGAVEDLSRQALEKQFSSNVFGTHELTIKLMKKLLASDSPHIIQISSIFGIVAMKYRGAYISSKFALEGLTDTLRLELSDTKVQVSLIEPGPIVSKFRENAQKALIQNVNIEKSRHCDSYKIAMKRFSSDKKQPFTLPEDAVYQKVRRIISVKKAKPRYYVTFPTYLFGILKRFLSTKMLDKILLSVSDKEKDRFNSN